MIRKQFSFLVLALLLGVLLSACGGRPQISVSTPDVELGDVVNGDIVTREISVENGGTAELVVDTITTSCGCTQARLEPMTIPAGGSGTLMVEFDSGAHGPELTGQLIRQVFINSNDPQQPEAIVELAVNILPAEES